MDSQTCLFVWHIQSSERTKFFTSGQNAVVFKLANKVATFIDKLKLWEQRINKKIFDTFQTLAKTSKDSEPEQVFSDLVSSHLRALLLEFKRSFPHAQDPQNAKEWICSNVFCKTKCIFVFSRKTL